MFHNLIRGTWSQCTFLVQHYHQQGNLTMLLMMIAASVFTSTLSSSNNNISDFSNSSCHNKVEESFCGCAEVLLDCAWL